MPTARTATVSVATYAWTVCHTALTYGDHVALHDNVLCSTFQEQLPIMQATTSCSMNKVDVGTQIFNKTEVIYLLKIASQEWSTIELATYEFSLSDGFNSVENWINALVATSFMEPFLFVALIHNSCSWNVITAHYDVMSCPPSCAQRMVWWLDGLLCVECSQSEDSCKSLSYLIFVVYQFRAWTQVTKERVSWQKPESLKCWNFIIVCKRIALCWSVSSFEQHNWSTLCMIPTNITLQFYLKSGVQWDHGSIWDLIILRIYIQLSIVGCSISRHSCIFSAQFPVDNGTFGSDNLQACLANGEAWLLVARACIYMCATGSHRSQISTSTITLQGFIGLALHKFSSHIAFLCFRHICQLPLFTSDSTFIMHSARARPQNWWTKWIPSAWARCLKI